MNEKRRNLLEYVFYDESLMEKLQSDEMKKTLKKLDEYILDLDVDPKTMDKLYNLVIENELNFFILGNELHKAFLGAA